MKTRQLVRTRAIPLPGSLNGSLYVETPDIQNG